VLGVFGGVVGRLFVRVLNLDLEIHWNGKLNILKQKNVQNIYLK
jgi:hypothetical protein